jgi:hypothetical protein
MKKTVIFLTIFSLYSCQNLYNYNSSSPVTSTKKTIQPTHFEKKALISTINRAFDNKVSTESLEFYNKKLQDTLENSQNDFKLSFKSPDNLLKVNIILNKSFKITDKNLYCREYAQNIEYINEIIDNISVACRKGPKLWQNLVLLTK